MPRLRHRRKDWYANRSRPRSFARDEHSLTTPAVAAREIGSAVYFIRCDDGLIKIGYTGNLTARRAAYGPGWKRVLVAMPGSLAHERACHRLHAAHLARGREYFNPHPDLLAHINEIREHLNVPPLDFAADPTGQTVSESWTIDEAVDWFTAIA